jgi:hypothetical protein
MSTDFGSVGSESSFTLWKVGTWTSELNDVSLRNDNDNGNEWNYLYWTEEDTENSDDAYVLVEILDESDNVLRSDLSGYSDDGINMRLNLNVFNNVKSVDIKVKFKLYSKNKNPIVSNVILT